MKPFLVISALYLPFLVFMTGISGHLYYFGDPSMFFSSIDSQGYKVIADYYMSLGNSERPSPDLLALRPFIFPLYLGLYHWIGIAGVQALQVMMNAVSLGVMFVAIQALTSRAWLASLCVALLAITPSFNLLVFHGLTETLSICLVCIFIALIVEHFKNYSHAPLFGATLVLSTLLCIRPIMLPFWGLFLSYYVTYCVRQRMSITWRPIMSITPVFGQLVISLAMTGSATLSSSGSLVLSSWYFPLVYAEKEYGKFTGRKSKETEEGMRRFPALKDKVWYLLNNHREALYAYLRILVAENFTAGSNFARLPGQTDGRSKRILEGLEKWSIYLNRLLLCLHLTMLVLIGSLIAREKRICGQKAMWVSYLFAVLLILPAGFTYLQGDRYILVAAPLWLVAHAALFCLFIESLKRRNESKFQAGELKHSSTRTVIE
jgi:hypothetical protein